MQRKWLLREYRPGDEEQIIGLHNQVLTLRQDITFWEWLYKKNLGRSCIWVAEDEHSGKLIGHFGSFPVRFKVADRILPGLKSGDYMVHAEYRRQGIFPSLGREFLKECMNRGIALVYSCPNANSYYSLVKKLNYKNIFARSRDQGENVSRIEGIPLLAKPLNCNNIVKKYIGNSFAQKLMGIIGNFILRAFELYYDHRRKPLKGVSINRVYSFDDRINSFWEEVSDHYKIIVVRDKEHLTWRYIQNNGKEYVIFTAEAQNRIRGYIVLRCAEEFGLRIGLIVDALAVAGGGEICRGLISKATEYFREQNVDAFGSIMLKHHYYYKALRGEGFWKIPRRFSPKQTYFAVYRISPEIPESFFLDPSNWFFTFGDSEIM